MVRVGVLPGTSRNGRVVVTQMVDQMVLLQQVLIAGTCRGESLARTRVIQGTTWGCCPGTTKELLVPEEGPPASCLSLSVVLLCCSWPPPGGNPAQRPLTVTTGANLGVNGCSSSGYGGAASGQEEVGNQPGLRCPVSCPGLKWEPDVRLSLLTTYG